VSNSVSRVLYLTVIYLVSALPQISSPLSGSRAGYCSLGLLRVGFTRDFSRHRPCVLLPHISTIGYWVKMHRPFNGSFIYRINYGRNMQSVFLLFMPLNYKRYSPLDVQMYAFGQGIMRKRIILRIGCSALFFHQYFPSILCCTILGIASTGR